MQKRNGLMQWWREGGWQGLGPARKCSYLVNIYNFNKNN
jgi:hypothetical protein